MLDIFRTFITVFIWTHTHSVNLGINTHLNKKVTQIYVLILCSLSFLTYEYKKF